MLEIGRVVALEEEAVWIETTEKSTCGGCAAKQACGQNVLASLYPERSRQVKISTIGHSGKQPKLHDQVSFELPDNALLFGALRVYLLPLATMIVTPLTLSMWTSSELALITGSFMGLCAGFALSRAVDQRTVSASYTPKLVKILS